MGTGPEIDDGADIVLAELEEGFTVRAMTSAGERIVEGLSLATATQGHLESAAEQVATVRASIGYPVATGGLAERLRAVPDHPRWAEIAERCLACTNCTLVCPTCFCTSVAPTSDLDGTTGSTERVWDSCFTVGFGRVAGDANFRPYVADRYRQWLTHKFSSWWDQFGSSGCVGCGRCITWCPVGSMSAKNCSRSLRRTRRPLRSLGRSPLRAGTRQRRSRWSSQPATCQSR
jgi:formate hydrogenlyase subunit 6/NADH:ubiquinone oxidoreductase subunit I